MLGGSFHIDDAQAFEPVCKGLEYWIPRGALGALGALAALVVLVVLVALSANCPVVQISRHQFEFEKLDCHESVSDKAFRGDRYPR